jgi:hypothetical protein
MPFDMAAADAMSMEVFHPRRYGMDVWKMDLITSNSPAWIVTSNGVG